MTATDAGRTRWWTVDSTPAISIETVHRWLNPPSMGATRMAAHELVAALRSAGIAALYLDKDADTANEVAALAREVRDLSERIASLPDTRASGTPAGDQRAPTVLTERSAISGRSNVAAPPLQVHCMDDHAIGRAVFGEVHEGPTGHVHGGIIAGMYDELLGVAQIYAGAVGYTVELDVRYHRMTPLFEPIVFRADVLSRDGKVVRLRGTCHAEAEPDVELNTAVGTFIARARLVPEDTTG